MVGDIVEVLQTIVLLHLVVSQSTVPVIQKAQVALQLHQLLLQLPLPLALEPMVNAELGLEPVLQTSAAHPLDTVV